MRFPKKPTSKDVPPQSASAVTGYWYWLLKDGALIGGTDDVHAGLWNHFEIICRLLRVKSDDKNVVRELHPLYKQGVMWRQYRALRVSIAFNHSELNVQVYGQPTTAQFEALRTIFYRNRQRIVWELGIEYRKDLSGAGSFVDFETAVEKHFGK